MRTRPLSLVSLAIVCLLTAIALIALWKLPTGAQLPIHWNAAGEVDQYANARYALFMPVVITAVLSALFSILPRLEPLQERMIGSATLLEASWVGLLALMVLVQLMIAGPAFGLVIAPTIIFAGLGILLIVVGNSLPKSRPGFFVGIRTPWALTDTNNWVATHRFGSWTMMLGGAIIALAAVLPLSATIRSMAVYFALALAALPPVVYSWWFWRRTRNRI